MPIVSNTGMAAATAGLLFAAVKIYDGFSDPMLGAISDQTRTVLGRHPDCDIVVDLGAVSRRHAQVLVSK